VLEDDFVGIGGNLQPGTLIGAYEQGLFPMPLPADVPDDVLPPGNERIGWWSPNPRGIIPLDGLKVSRSLRKSLRRFEIRIDTAFETVIEACAAPGRHGAWISEDIRTAYCRLHRLRIAHSVEAWDHEGHLAGGLYGVCLGGLFAGESMFHHQRDASKAALVGLVDILRADGTERLLDVQWVTDHLASLGAVEVSREHYLELLDRALELPPPPAFQPPSR
jgi:leucyl/phenylalanyl-tRNA--protein transferase